MTYLLYRAAEIRLGDQVVGLGTINRIERKLGEITLHWQHWPGSYRHRRRRHPTARTPTVLRTPDNRPALAGTGRRVIVFPLMWNSPPLRSNKRLHHMAEHRIKQDIRHVGYIQAKSHMGIRHPLTFPLPHQVEIVLIWTVPTKHRRDASSGAPTIKSWVDGAVDAGLLHDDSWVWVKREYCEIEHRPGEPMSLRVEIREVTE